MDKLPIFLDSTLLAAIIAAVIVAWTYLHQRIREKEIKKSALFAELRHINKHYLFAGDELFFTTDKRELEKLLNWAIYGPVLCVKNFDSYAIFGVEEMQQLLQVDFRIRNTDWLINKLCKNIIDISDTDIQELKKRMNYIESSVQMLIKYMQKNDKKLALI